MCYEDGTDFSKKKSKQVVVKTERIFGWGTAMGGGGGTAVRMNVYYVTMLTN